MMAVAGLGDEGAGGRGAEGRVGGRFANFLHDCRTEAGAGRDTKEAGCYRGSFGSCLERHEISNWLLDELRWRGPPPILGRYVRFSITRDSDY